MRTSDNMGSIRFKHNKKRNSGLVYEFLVRKMSQSVIEGNSSDYKKTLSIFKKYFSAGQPLAVERQLFEVITSTRGVKPTVARGIIKEVSAAARKLDHRLTNIKKSKLIKDIHTTFGRNLFSSYRLDEYKVYASIQLLVNSCNPRGSINESVQRVELEEALVCFMQSHKSPPKEKINPDPLVYKIAMEKFNERYDSSLNESQKRLLKNYIKALATPDVQTESLTRDLLTAERQRIICELATSTSVKEITEDKEMVSKLKKVKDTLQHMNLSKPTSAHVEDLMLYCGLVEELNSHD